MSSTRSACLLLLNLALLGALALAAYYGYFALLWNVDFSKLSFVILFTYFVTAGFVCFGRYREKVVQEIADLLLGVALIGTVLGIILVTSVLAAAVVSGGAEFKTFMGPVLHGLGTAFHPTLLGISGAVLLRAQALFLSP